MRIAVLIKQVPDTYGARTVASATGLVDRIGSEAVVDEIGERAVEAALVMRAALPGTTVTAVTMGPERALEALRKALSMGVDDGVHVVDDGLTGADLTLTAEVLAAALRTLHADLVLTGNVSTDGGGGVLGAMLAEHLGVAHVTNLAAIESDGFLVRGVRVTDSGSAVVSSSLPAVASVTEAVPDPRFPSFKDIMTARKKPVETISAAQLGADLAGVSVARSIVIAVRERPARLGGTKVVDDGDGGRKLAEYLIARNLA